MRFKSHLQPDWPLSFLEVTALINILLLLLIFFFLSSNFIDLTGLSIDLPRIVTSETITHEQLAILVSAENLYYLQGRLVSLTDLRERLRQAKANSSTVLIKADNRASLGKLTEILNFCREIGFEKVNVVASR